MPNKSTKIIIQIHLKNTIKYKTVNNSKTSNITTQVVGNARTYKWVLSLDLKTDKACLIVKIKLF